MSFKSLIIVLIQLSCSVYIVVSNGVIPSNIYSILILIDGVLLGMWAMMEFRFRFNIFPELLENSKLITSGPYRFIRHPIYTAVLMITVAYVINYPTYINIAVWVTLLIVLIIKIQYEERLLNERFTDYAQYKSKTKALIPFLV